MDTNGKRLLYFTITKGYAVLLVAVVFGRITASDDGKACPKRCFCDFDQLIVNCSGMVLLDVPKRAQGDTLNWTESLDFSGNLLQEVDTETLSGFPGLHDLTLADNQLHGIANSSFRLLVDRLHRLSLRANQLVVVPSAIRELRSLRVLDLSLNSLWFLDSNTFTGLDSLESLNLDQNSLHVFDGAAFHSLTSLHKLSMTGNFLAEDPVGWFAFSPVRQLYLSHNQIPLASDLRSWFDPNDTAPLEYLGLVNNEIKSLPKGRFRGMDYLRELDLGENQIITLTEDSLEGLFNLVDLSLDANLLEYIDERSFHSTLNLQVLKLDGNQLLSLPRGLFSHTKRLTKLNAARNRLEDISAITDAQLPEMTELYLFSNSLRAIGSQGFTSLPMLSQLVAGGNHFTHIPNVTNLPELHTLELSQNQIKLVSHNAFQGSTALRGIYLHWNKLERLDYEPFVELYDLVTLTLSHNPWWCDCRIEWMLDLLYAEYPPPWVEDIATREVYCENPPELRFTPIERITQEDLVLRCPNPPNRTVILALLGTWFGIVFICVARLWIRKLAKAHKRKKISRRNSKYHSRLTRKKRNGVISNHIRGYSMGRSESYALILQNKDNDEQDGDRSNNDNRNFSREREEVARVTTV